MKKLSIFALALSAGLLFSACGNLVSNYDANSDGIDKIFKDVTKTVGEDSKIDEIKIMFSDDPGQESMISYFMVDFQSKSDQKELLRVEYHGHSGWTQVEPLEITVRGNPEDFDLNNEVNPFSQFRPDIIKKVYDSAIQKVGEECDNIKFVSISADPYIDEDIEYSTYLEGTLKSNNVTKKIFLYYDKEGNLIDK